MSSVLKALRQDAQTLFDAGVLAADPYQAVQQHLQFEGQTLSLQTAHSIRRAHWEKIHLIAIGKAAVRMIQAAHDIIPSHLLSKHSLAITNSENYCRLEDIQVIAAGHPLPNDAGLHAAQQVKQIVQQAKKNELVLILLSGGGSALLPLPAKGIQLAEKITTTDLLLQSGATINEMNCVRKHLSQLKGGQLAELASPADLHSCILSDVLGDDLSTIASGPTVPDSSSFAQAVQILKDKNIWHALPNSVQHHLSQGQQGHIAETPSHVFKQASHCLIGSNIISLNAVEKSAKAQNYATQIYNAALTGEVNQVAAEWVSSIKQTLNHELSQPLALLAGGETTVTLMGKGLGGRNQQLALAFAIEAEKQQLKAQWVFLSGGTDGRDGPTDAAGGLVDSNSLLRMNQSGIEPEHYLANNNSYYALKNSQDLLVTGATGTNVADLQILLIHPNL